MTIKPIDMQVVVPRTGEVERINRTVQGQQQTDQQIVNQSIQESLKQKEQSVNNLEALEQKKIDNEEQEQKKEKKQKDKNNLETTNTEEINENKDQAELQSRQISNSGRYLDVKI